MSDSNISSEATWPVVTKSYVEPSGVEGTKICSNDSNHMTNMVAMPVGSKRSLKTFFFGTNRLMALYT